jgi:hypothetical protein
VQEVTKAVTGGNTPGAPSRSSSTAGQTPFPAPCPGCCPTPCPSSRPPADRAVAAGCCRGAFAEGDARPAATGSTSGCSLRTWRCMWSFRPNTKLQLSTGHGIDFWSAPHRGSTRERTGVSVHVCTQYGGYGVKVAGVGVGARQGGGCDEGRLQNPEGGSTACGCGERRKTHTHRACMGQGVPS